MATHSPLLPGRQPLEANPKSRWFRRSLEISSTSVNQSTADSTQMPASNNGEWVAHGLYHDQTGAWCTRSIWKKPRHPPQDGSRLVERRGPGLDLNVNRGKLRSQKVLWPFRNDRTIPW